MYFNKIIIIFVLKLKLYWIQYNNKYYQILTEKIYGVRNNNLKNNKQQQKQNKTNSIKTPLN